MVGDSRLLMYHSYIKVGNAADLDAYQYRRIPDRCVQIGASYI